MPHCENNDCEVEVSPEELYEDGRTGSLLCEGCANKVPLVPQSCSQVPGNILNWPSNNDRPALRLVGVEIESCVYLSQVADRCGIVDTLSQARNSG